MSVRPDAAVRVRLIGAGTLLYQVVCFEDHQVTLIGVDARAVEPLSLKNGCVDVNLGQRMDVILKTKTLEELNASNSTSFWITGRATGRPGQPASYGVLSYGSDGAAVLLPKTAAPQPSDTPINWSEDNFTMKITSPNGTVPSWVTSKEPADRTVYLDMTQPVLQQTAQLRCAMSNALYLKTPSCTNS